MPFSRAFCSWLSSPCFSTSPVCMCMYKSLFMCVRGRYIELEIREGARERERLEREREKERKRIERNRQKLSNYIERGAPQAVQRYGDRNWPQGQSEHVLQGGE